MPATAPLTGVDSIPFFFISVPHKLSTLLQAASISLPDLSPHFRNTLYNDSQAKHCQLRKELLGKIYPGSISCSLCTFLLSV